MAKPKFAPNPPPKIGGKPITGDGKVICHETKKGVKCKYEPIYKGKKNG
jgi:hypothetical protein